MSTGGSNLSGAKYESDISMLFSLPWTLRTEAMSYKAELKKNDESPFDAPSQLFYIKSDKHIPSMRKDRGA